jgi:hypothetical protein
MPRMNSETLVIQKLKMQVATPLSSRHI